MISELMDAAVQFGIAAKEPEREPGFHASSSGMCYRRLLTQVMNPDFCPPNSDRTERIFSLGHILHDIVHIGLQKRMWYEGGSIWHINPMRLVAFEDKATDFRVVGTPDELLFDVAEQRLHIIDAKSASNDSFKYKKRMNAEASTTHSLQVGTYMAALMEQLKNMPHTADIRMSGWVSYINKDNLETMTIHAGDDELAINAANYWVHNVKPMWIEALASGRMPQAVPHEEWQCGYCALFPQDDAKTTATKKKRGQMECKHTSAEELLTLNHQQRYGVAGNGVDGSDEGSSGRGEWLDAKRSAKDKPTTQQSMNSLLDAFKGVK